MSEVIRGVCAGFLAIALLACAKAAAIAAPEGALIHYRFDQADGRRVPNAAGAQYAGRIQGNARVTRLPDAGGTPVLSLDGTNGCIQIEGSEALHLGEDGFAIAATVRFKESGSVEGAPETHDMIVMKPGEYLFGRTRRSLYFNIHDGNDWVAGITGGDCQPNTWIHAAVLVERIYEPPQGRVGYFIRLYQNGEQVAAREVLHCTSATTDDQVNIGKGFGGPWFHKGEIAHLSLYNRALASTELNALLRAEKLAKVRFKHVAASDARYPALLAKAREAVMAQPDARRRPLARLLAAVEQANIHVESQAALLPYLETVRRVATSGQDPMRQFAAAHREFTFLDNERLSMALFAPRRGRIVLCSLYDLRAEREVLGEQRALWALHYETAAGGQPHEIDSTADSLAMKLTVHPSRKAARLEWTHAGSAEHPIQFTVRSELALQGPRLALNFSLDNRSPRIAVRQARFPIIRLRRLEEGTDRLLVPRMSGVVHENPVQTYFKYEGPYPSGAAHMQFFAYYDDRGGVYVACEDGKARSKDLRALGDDNDCDLSYLWHVGCQGAGGNDFATNGVAAVELFEGDWFDAAQIYKRFTRTAEWWPASRSREDIPAWYREMTVWFLGNANTQAAADALIAMREELGLPIGLHWYNWNTEAFDDDYPHYTPREGFAETTARLRAKGVYVKPYINARLWETRDRGDEDFEYTSVALPATVKDRQGKPVTETYAKRTFSPMCPTTEVWQQRVHAVCTQLAQAGVAGIYLDQIAAARPRPCFDPTHPHAAGSGEAWIEQGYWPMLTAIRRDLKQKYPELIFNSEDAAEPYMHVLDGYLPWRFLDIGHVPAYQSIYAGRIQMTSRSYSDTAYDALFPKAAEQMLYGEQVGWFPISLVNSNPVFKLFVKKLAHTRRAFLPYFNEGDMLKPAAFASEMPTVTADWGFYGPRVITTPAVLHSAWRLGNNIAVVFANTSCDSITAQVAPNAAAWGLDAKPVRVTQFAEGKDPEVAEWQPGQPLRLTVPGYSMAAWLFVAGGNDAGNQAHASAATELFRALKRFEDEAGLTPEKMRAERAAQDPWSVPDAPVRTATEWIPASEAPKLVRARKSPDGSFVGWISASSAVCFGAIDFGADAGGKPAIECEVAVPPHVTNARIRFMEAVDGRGVPLATARLPKTGGYDQYTTVRLPLATGVAGRKNIVVIFEGRGSGLCNVRRWRLVREP